MSEPFSHDELELKQHFLNLGREYLAKSDSLESELAAGLIYMNLADYIGEYLVSGFNALSQDAVSKFYFGVIGVRPQKKEGLNIGNSIKQLEAFDFPKKSEIISKLGEINKCRIKIAHELFKTPGNRLEEMDEAIRNLAAKTEELISVIDEISPGMPPKNLLTPQHLSIEQTIEKPDTPKRKKK